MDAISSLKNLYLFSLSKSCETLFQISLIIPILSSSNAAVPFVPLGEAEGSTA